MKTTHPLLRFPLLALALAFPALAAAAGPEPCNAQAHAAYLAASPDAASFFSQIDAARRLAAGTPEQQASALLFAAAAERGRSKAIDANPQSACEVPLLASFELIDMNNSKALREHPAKALLTAAQFRTLRSAGAALPAPEKCSPEQKQRLSNSPEIASAYAIFAKAQQKTYSAFALGCLEPENSAKAAALAGIARRRLALAIRSAEPDCLAPLMGNALLKTFEREASWPKTCQEILAPEPPAKSAAPSAKAKPPLSLPALPPLPAKNPAANPK